VEHAERLGARLQPLAAPALGLIETSSIARGFEVADAVVKQSPVRLVWARTASPGKFVTLFVGDVEEVRQALARGLEVARDSREDDVFIPNVHPALLDAVKGPRKVPIDAFGIVETKTVASALLAADAAAKAAAAELVEVRLAQHLGGKGFFTVAGATDDVEASVARGADLARAKGTLVREVVIPQAAPELLEHIF
jgi:microcompartment protein CcmL/EutN